MLGTYAFFAVRMPVTLIGAVVALGILLMLGQIVKIAKQRARCGDKRRCQWQLIKARSARTRPALAK